MEQKMRKKLIKFLMIGAFSTTIFVFLWFFVFLESICNWSQGVCVLSAFLIQSPAHFFNVLIENIFNTTLTSNQLRWVFLIVIPLFWFVIGSGIGFIIYYIKNLKIKKIKN